MAERARLRKRAVKAHAAALANEYPGKHAPESDLSDSQSEVDSLVDTDDFHDPVDPTLRFFYRRRSITALVAATVGVVYMAFFVAHGDTLFNIKLGVAVAAAALLLIGVLQFRDGPFIRPHPAFWRLVLGLSVLYEMVLLFILLQEKAHVRAWLGALDPTLGRPLPERNYAENCELTMENVRSQVWDVFVLAHFLGWWAKAIIVRDSWFCWILSVMFEIMEYSLQYQLPNFAECWWDHWILDVLVCNWAGIYAGVKTCEYFEMKQYSWRGVRDIPSVSGKLRRTVAQFTPHSWTKFQWGSTTNFPRFAAVVGLLALILVCELNAFYLKYLLWLPPAHPINIYRLVLYFFMCVPAVREAYQYMTDPRCKRFGMHAWLVTANIVTELLICVKFGQGEFPAAMPRYVKVLWMVMSALLGAWCLGNFGYPALAVRFNWGSSHRLRVSR